MYGHNIRKLRKSSGLTQKRLSEVLSVSRTTVSAWENCLTEPNIDNIIKLKKTFGVSYEELLED